MIKNVLVDIANVSSYGIVSLSIFFLFFSGMLVWAASLRKPYLKAMSEAPLRDDARAGQRNGGAR